MASGVNTVINLDVSNSSATLENYRLKFYLNFTVRFSESLGLAQSKRSLKTNGKSKRANCKRCKICKNGKNMGDGKTANCRPKSKKRRVKFYTHPPRSRKIYEL